jgi:hypothetical protein
MIFECNDKKMYSSAVQYLYKSTSYLLDKYNYCIVLYLTIKDIRSDDGPNTIKF